MRYQDIIKAIAARERVPEETVENEMRQALRAAGVSCSPEEFILSAAVYAQKGLYIV